MRPDTGVSDVRAALTGGYTAAALLWGLAHHGTVHRRHGLIVVAGMRGGHGWRQGVTVGQVYLTGDAQQSAGLLRHEGRHVDQWAVLGAAFPFVYELAELLGEAAGEGSSGNLFEAAAGLRDGNYDPPPADPSFLAPLLRLVSPADDGATSAVSAPEPPGPDSQRMPAPEASNDPVVAHPRRRQYRRSPLPGGGGNRASDVPAYPPTACGRNGTGATQLCSPRSAQLARVREGGPGYRTVREGGPGYRTVREGGPGYRLG
jgi:hypothetical protein